MQALGVDAGESVPASKNAKKETHCHRFSLVLTKMEEFEEKGIAFDCFASSDNISIMSFLFP